MDKKEVIDDIFKDYHRRLNYLKSINLLISNLKNGRLLKESEEVYSTNYKNINEMAYLDVILEKKESMERMIELRNLLLEQLTKEERYICDMRFDKGMRVKEIIRFLYISEATYYRKLKNIYCKLIEYYNLFEGLFMTN